MRALENKIKRLESRRKVRKRNRIKFISPTRSVESKYYFNRNTYRLTLYVKFFDNSFMISNILLIDWKI